MTKVKYQSAVIKCQPQSKLMYLEEQFLLVKEIARSAGEISQRRTAVEDELHID